MSTEAVDISLNKALWIIEIVLEYKISCNQILNTPQDLVFRLYLDTGLLD